MQAAHILLGRPWQYDKEAIHNVMQPDMKPEGVPRLNHGDTETTVFAGKLACSGNKEEGEKDQPAAHGNFTRSREGLLMMCQGPTEAAQDVPHPMEDLPYLPMLGGYLALITFGITKEITTSCQDPDQTSRRLRPPYRRRTSSCQGVPTKSHYLPYSHYRYRNITVPPHVPRPPSLDHSPSHDIHSSIIRIPCLTFLDHSSISPANISPHHYLPYLAATTIITASHHIFTAILPHPFHRHLTSSILTIPTFTSPFISNGHKISPATTTFKVHSTIITSRHHFITSGHKSHHTIYFPSSLHHHYFMPSIITNGYEILPRLPYFTSSP